MKWNPEPGQANSRDEFYFFLRVALEGSQPPPKEFVAAVMTNKLPVSPEIMNKLVEKGWLPRQPCEIWSRVMGYYRPVSLWNVGKQAEYRERVQLDPKKICD